MNARKTKWKALAVAAVIAPAVFGGTPQPCMVVYGLVRDAYGYPYLENAQLTLKRDQSECACYKIQGLLSGGVNYRTELNMDSGGGYYAPFAVHKNDSISVAVEVGGVSQPLIPTNRFVAGKPGSVLRLDLCAGADADGDGLPDEWEQQLIDQSGGALTGIAEVRPGDDFDRDGLSNLQEFQAGTFPFLHTDLLQIDKAEKVSAARMKITFLTSPRITYRLVATGQLAEKSWFPVAFAAEENGALAYSELVGDGAYRAVYVDAALPVLFLRIATQ